ncbi:hypothetical protein RB614_09040 [Phytohabitans sp. ZYX-F-186]|uniref:Uncharacterized protein n=1 Tax=Phytohabitans maris TaxID=3071409 RepID=A0ABU0ZC66_9ACTN|nr:hypothetical protein [Phytohabitans sp. ZYX-F-186]MDQ7904664.1 hypothetical protein [Phytohabitans sp. ZYX-F-186]
MNRNCLSTLSIVAVAVAMLPAGAAAAPTAADPPPAVMPAAGE